MLPFKFLDKCKISTALQGKLLLSTPQLNKGTGFSQEERKIFGLLGKLPMPVETLESQSSRCYKQYKLYKDHLQRNLYLNDLHDTNEVLFYHLLGKHLGEMLPDIYTPIVGNAVKNFSSSYRHARGLYLAYPEQDFFDEILQNRSNPEIDLIVVTDGEGVLGIGDQGVGGMDIPIAKLMVYTLCGGINPLRTLPIFLDAGTNNKKLLEDPGYLGWRHTRITGKDYDTFVNKFVTAIQKAFPWVYLHWEDFGRENARKNLETYRNKICSFNDDMQGTGVVTLAALLAAVKAKKEKLHEQKIVVFGGGTAGIGIADQILAAMQKEGCSKTDALKQFWILDKPGLLIEGMPELTDFQQRYARDPNEILDWQVENRENINLETVIEHVHPSVLIGASAVAGAFTQSAIKQMASFVAQPIILPLSNPTERVEATPSDLIHWSKGTALIATGSPFSPVKYENTKRTIAQCNNALAFPGIGLGVILAKPRHISDEALWAACKALSEKAPVLQDLHKALLPSVDMANHIAADIAAAVILQFIQEDVNTVNWHFDSIEDLKVQIRARMWEAKYPTLIFSAE